MLLFFFFFQAEDGIRDGTVTGVQTCALPILPGEGSGLLVLEAAEHARARGATVHGEVAGFAASAGAGQLAGEEDPAPLAERLARVIESVLDASGETPDLVSLHGDSVPAHDA